MQKLMLASSNLGKIAEIEELLQHMDIDLIPQSTMNITDADETAVTFIENALIKARHASQLSGLPALADDSGLSVTALNGAPGVYSARYAGHGASDQDRNQKLLKELSTINPTDRSAEYHSVMVLLRFADDPAPLICHGHWKGEILSEPRGNGGFGYDPVFYIPELQLTAAELSPQQKNAISHRGQAMQQLLKKLQSKTF